MNRFDQQLSGYGYELGFIKKLGRSIEKAVKKVNKVVKENIRTPIAKATLPSKVREIGRDMDEKGINKALGAIAVGVIGTVFTGGAAAPMMSKLMAGAAASVSSSLATKGLEDYQEYQVAKIIAQNEAEIADQLMQITQESPAFKELVEQLRAEGYTDEEILMHWLESETFYREALTSVENMMLPLVEAEVQTLNQQQPPEKKIPQNEVPAVAAGITEHIVKVEVDRAQQTGAIPTPATGQYVERVVTETKAPDMGAILPLAAIALFLR